MKIMNGYTKIVDRKVRLKNFNDNRIIESKQRVSKLCFDFHF